MSRSAELAGDGLLPGSATAGPEHRRRSRSLVRRRETGNVPAWIGEGAGAGARSCGRVGRQLAKQLGSVVSRLKIPREHAQSPVRLGALGQKGLQPCKRSIRTGRFRVDRDVDRTFAAVVFLAEQLKRYPTPPPVENGPLQLGAVEQGARRSSRSAAPLEDRPRGGQPCADRPREGPPCANSLPGETRR